MFSWGPRVPTGFPGPGPSLFPFTVIEINPIFAIIKKALVGFYQCFFRLLGPLGARRAMVLLCQVLGARTLHGQTAALKGQSPHRIASYLE